MGRHQRRRAIIIDDEAWIREGISEHVGWERLGIELVRAFADGVEAYEYLEREPVDLILTDIRMPNMSGLELLARLRELGAVKSVYLRVKVIFLSGYGDFKYAQEALRLGAVDYLLKPAEVEEIEAALAKAKHQLAGLPLISAAPERPAMDDYAEEEPNSYLIKKAVQLLSDRYQEDLHLADLAGELFITPNYLSRLFRLETGKSFIELLTEFRLDKAISMLSQDIVKIYEVGQAVGYPNPRYFSDWFHKNMGMSPGEYRNLHFRT